MPETPSALRDIFGHMTKSDDQGARARLLAAAVLELAERGWGGLRTRSVAERAGVNKGLVHYHFGSMDNLRFEAIATVMTEAVNDAASQMLTAQTLAAGIREFCGSLGAFTGETPEGIVLMDAMVHVPREPRLQEMLQRALDAYEAALAGRIAQDIESGSLRPDVDATALARALTALLDGLVMHAYVRPDADFVAAGESLAVLFTLTPDTKG